MYKRQVEESISGLEETIPVATEAGLRCEGVISTSFGCPYEGDVPVENVLRLALRLARAGCVEVGFGDTTGMANPLQVCLLYTSDAADERSSVDLGGRRIIKKKISTQQRRHVDTTIIKHRDERTHYHARGD